MADEYGQFVEWIDSQEDGDEIRKARALLAAWRQHAERGSAERDAAIRLDIRCERRLGQLPEMAPKRPGPSKIVTASHEPAHAAERKALSRARALAAILLSASASPTAVPNRAPRIRSSADASAAVVGPGRSTGGRRRAGSIPRPMAQAGS